MILELAIAFGAATCAGALFAARRARRAGRSTRAAQPPSGQRRTELGDVVVLGAEELWLTGVIAWSESGRQVRLFCAPEGRSLRWYAELDSPTPVRLVLSDAAVAAGAVPSELTHASRVYRLDHRQRVQATMAGENLPCRVADQMQVTWLRASGDRYLVVLDMVGGARIALAGDALHDELFEVWPGAGGAVAAQSASPSGQAD